MGKTTTDAAFARLKAERVPSGTYKTSCVLQTCEDMLREREGVTIACQFRECRRIVKLAIAPETQGCAMHRFEPGGHACSEAIF